MLSKQSIVLVVCDGTNNYVNHFYANFWIDLEALKDKIKSVWFSHAINMEPIKKLEWLSGEKDESQPKSHT